MGDDIVYYQTHFYSSGQGLRQGHKTRTQDKDKDTRQEHKTRTQDKVTTQGHKHKEQHKDTAQGQSEVTSGTTKHIITRLDRRHDTAHYQTRVDFSLSWRSASEGLERSEEVEFEVHI